MRFFSNEIGRARGFIVALLITSALLLVGFTVFFAFVGKFDGGSDSAIFNELSASLAISSTIAGVVIAVAGSVWAAQNVVQNYIGDNRAYLYIYPDGRRPLFHTKMAITGIATGLGTFIGFLLGISTLGLVRSISPAAVPGEVSNTWILQALVAAVGVSLFAGASAAIASSFGVHQQSSVGAVVLAVILVTLLGNPLAGSLMVSEWLTLGLGIVLLILATLFVVYEGNRVAKDEVFPKH